MEEAGRNRTPDKLPAKEREPLFAACDRHLKSVVRALEPEWVIGVGTFAESRAREVLADEVRVGRILHPSPANPRAQKNWSGIVKRELEALGVHPYEAEQQTRGYVENDKRVLRELAGLYDPEIPAHENEAYVEKTKELSASHEDAMRGSAAIFGDRTERSWLPPSKDDVDTVTAENAE